MIPEWRGALFEVSGKKKKYNPPALERSRGNGIKIKMEVFQWYLCEMFIAFFFSFSNKNMSDVIKTLFINIGASILKRKSLIHINTVLKELNQQLKSRAKMNKIMSGLFCCRFIIIYDDFQAYVSSLSEQESSCRSELYSVCECTCYMLLVNWRTNTGQSYLKEKKNPFQCHFSGKINEQVLQALITQMICIGDYLNSHQLIRIKTRRQKSPDPQLWQLL